MKTKDTKCGGDITVPSWQPATIKSCGDAHDHSKVRGMLPDEILTKYFSKIKIHIKW